MTTMRQASAAPPTVSASRSSISPGGLACTCSVKKALTPKTSTASTTQAAMIASTHLKALAEKTLSCSTIASSAQIATTTIWATRITKTTTASNGHRSQANSGVGLRELAGHDREEHHLPAHRARHDNHQQHPQREDRSSSHGISNRDIVAR